ncbi:MAG: thymidine kinase [Bdellovibrionales bacterium]
MTAGIGQYRFRPGWIEVIVGCMFSGKTEELIKQVHRAQYARQAYQVFKPRLDARYSADHVASHNQTLQKATPVETAEEMLGLVERQTQVVGIDEGQFFGPDLVEVVTLMANAGKRVVIAGLDTDWRGRPFGPMPALMAVAEMVHKQYAICMVCGEPATRTQRLINAREDILVGSTEAYEARCRLHFDPDLSARLRPQTSPQTETRA